MSGQLARIMADAEILILDEPTPALDLKNQIVILDWIVGLSQEGGLTVVMTTYCPRWQQSRADIGFCHPRVTRTNMRREMTGEGVAKLFARGPDDCLRIHLQGIQFVGKRRIP